jgi:hypothetical protein
LDDIAIIQVFAIFIAIFGNFAIFYCNTNIAIS